MEIVSSKAITISVLTIIIIIIICCALCQSTWIYYILLLSRVRIVLNNNWLLIAFIKKKKNYCGRLAAAATYVNTKYIPRKTGISSYSFVHSNEHNRKPYPYDRTARFSFIEINCVCVCVVIVTWKRLHVRFHIHICISFFYTIWPAIIIARFKATTIFFSFKCQEDQENLFSNEIEMQKKKTSSSCLSSFFFLNSFSLKTNLMNIATQIHLCNKS